MDKSKKGVEIFDQYARQYQEKFMDQEGFSAAFDSFCAEVEKEDALILDLACGPGNITKYLLKKRPDLKITGIDLSPKMIELAKENNPSAEFLVMDCREINRFSHSFHGIVCGFGLPYLTKEEALKLIAEVSGLLQQEGVFYLSTMEDEYTKSGWKGPSDGGKEKIFIYYHQADYLIQAMQENGLEIIHNQRKAYPEPDGSLTTDLLLIGKKRTP